MALLAIAILLTSLVVSPFSLKACAEVNELFNLFQGGSIVHYIDGRCVSANDNDLNLTSWHSMIGQSVQMFCQHHLLVAEDCLLSLTGGPHHMHI